MITAFSLSAVYLLLLGVVLLRRTRRNPAESWLIAYCIYSALLMVLHGLVLGGQITLPADVPDQLIIGVGFTLSIGLTSALMLSYIGAKPRTMVIVGLLDILWTVGTLAARLTLVPSLTNLPAWLGPGLPDVATLGMEIAIGGWLIISLLLLVMIWRAYLVEPLPLYANRLLFWVMVGPALLGGDALSAWLRMPWNNVGYIVRLLGTVGAVYSMTVLHLLDLREFARRMFSAAVITLLISVVLFGAISLPAVVSFPNMDTTQRWLLRGLTAFVVGAMMVPLIQGLRWLLRRFLRSGYIEPAEAVRVYSERISKSVELEELSTNVSQVLKELLNVNRARLILTTQEATGVVLNPLGMADGGTGSCTVAADSPVYHQFLGKKQALLQYVIDYDRRYIQVPKDERLYFSKQGMDIYAPIVSEGRLLGLLALGPKITDEAFHGEEIELLEALANQTVTALENARLVADLRALNERITALNQNLKATNERLEKLDKVKSDFLTIASHELRTPLTQLQGNVDLLMDVAQGDTLAEERDEALEMIGALSRATRRMTEVVMAMEDITRVDVESMDLVFEETTPLEVVGVVVENYTPSARERDQMLIMGNLTELPPIMADHRRLEQAIGGLVSNAIKYTPDNGVIEIRGSIYERNEQGKPESIQICVKDSGIGIEPEHHELIFEKFYRVDSVFLHSTGTTKFKGAGPGLGLAIARAIVEGHGGRIWVESEGHDEEHYPGSTFYIVLPVTPPAIDARERIHRVHLAQLDTLIRKAPTAEEIAAAAEQSSPD